MMMMGKVARKIRKTMMRMLMLLMTVRMMAMVQVPGTVSRTA